MSIRTLIGVGGRLLVAALIAVPVYWVNGVLLISPIWNIALLLAVGLSVLPLGIWRALLLAGAAIVPLLLTPDITRQHDQTAALHVLTIGLLFALTLICDRPDAARRLALAAFGLGIGLIAVNFLAAFVLDELNRSDRPNVPPAALVDQDGLTINAAAELSLVGYAPTPTSIPTSPPAQPPVQPTPAPQLQVAGTGYMEFYEDGGEAAWGHLTGYGPRVNARARAYMLDANGRLVYDTQVEFNGKGARGPEVNYEKPDDVYRILIIGDSFVEALQVDYEQTFYAL